VDCVDKLSWAREFLEREIAIRRVEELVESSMMLALHDYIRQQKGSGNVR
jgi:hypothetical protein